MVRKSIQRSPAWAAVAPGAGAVGLGVVAQHALDVDPPLGVPGDGAGQEARAFGRLEALTELDDLLERMLTARGFAPDDPVAAEGDEPEVLASFRAAREITRLAESGADLSPGDIAPAIEDYREVYRVLTGQRAPH